jgi:hypothetical protein
MHVEALYLDKLDGRSDAPILQRKAVELRTQFGLAQSEDKRLSLSKCLAIAQNC